MGKFSNKDLPSFLKKPNYYSEDEQFDGETGRNPEVTEDCETCGQEPQVAENKVLRFADFLTEKKKYNPKYDKDGDGDNDFEDYKAFKTDAIKKKKTTAIKEGAMSEIDILAKESKTFKSFVRAFKKEYSNLNSGDNKELEGWLKSVYDAAKVNESWDPSDAYEYGATSNCCGASVMMGDICSDCGEHCEAEYWEEEGDGEEPEMFGPRNEGHTCHDGSKSMLSEAAHYLIESMCESTCSEAAMYESDEDPEHKFQGYLESACSYMENRMYEIVDDGMTVNEGWNNESACYESTCESIDAVCEKLCSEALEIHNDDSDVSYNDYVKEAIGCYRNGLMECAMSESENTEVFSKVSQWLANPENQKRSLTMSPQQQAAEIGITVEEYESAIRSIKDTL